MICRIRHGWTSEDDADAYERLLRGEIVADILRRDIPGFRVIDVLRRPARGDVEFVTIMWFDSIEAVRNFAGPNCEMAVVPLKARPLLKRFQSRSAHYDVIERRSHRDSSSRGCTGHLR